MPSPPFLLEGDDTPIEKANLSFVSSRAQMKFLRVLSTVLRILEGMEMYCMIWVRILLRKDLSRVVLPAMSRNFTFYPVSLECRLCIRNWKSLLKGLLWKIGKPKYFPKFSLTWTFSILVRLALVSGLQLLEKNTLDLIKLIFWTEWRLKWVIVFLIVLQFPSLDLAKRIRSSTQNRWEMGSPFLLMEMGFQCRRSIS